MNLKSTPYLVLFVILGSIAVTAAYAGIPGHIDMIGDVWVRETLMVDKDATVAGNLDAGTITESNIPLADIIRSFSSNVHTGTDSPNVVEPPNAEIGDLHIETLGDTTFLSIKLERSGIWRIIWDNESTPVFSDSQPPSNPPPDTTNGNIHIDISKGQIYFWNVLDDEWVLIDSFTIGTLDVTGDVTIGGHAAIDNDLHVGGDATVDGTLTVEGQTLADFLRDRSIEHHTGNEAPTPELGNEGDLFIRTGIGSESVWIKEPTGWRVLDLFGEARLFSSTGVPTRVLGPEVLDAINIQKDTNQLYEWNGGTQMWDLLAHLLPNNCADGQTSTFDTATDTWNCANLPGGTSFSFPELSCDATADNTCNVELSCGADRLFSWVSYLTDLDGNGIPPGGSVFGFCDGNLNGAGEEEVLCQCQNFSGDDARCVFRATCGN